MSEPKKANHQVNIVRLSEPRVHTNADTLELFDIGGYQVVVKKGQFKAGDLAVYIQPDSVVPQTEAFRFIWAQGLTAVVDQVQDGNILAHWEVPERRRRITVRKFRKEWSEGLLMPLTDFPGVLTSKAGPPGVTGVNFDFRLVSEGADVSDLLGITHWDGDDVESTVSDNDSRPKRKYPKTLKGWFFFLLYKAGLKSVKKQMNEELAFDVPKFDVENIKNFKNTITPEDDVIVTEKIHGSQGRYFFREGKMYAGSRNFWKSEKSPCVWRKVLRDHPWIENFCRENEGAILYGEVVPTQKGFRYGCDEGETNFFVFDIRKSDGEYLPKALTMRGGLGLTLVPLVYEGLFESDVLLNALTDGPSLVPATKTPREGVVITVKDPTRWQRGLGRIQLKAVSNKFLEKDSK
jgi:hypothetical protein